MPEFTPRFSIIIPTHRRPQQLAACLRSLRNLSYPRHLFEIIIVDDGATVTCELIEPFAGDLAIVWHAQRQTGPAGARNAGARLSRGEYLAFLDDDCQPEPDWLDALDMAFQKDPRVLAGGKIVNSLPDNVFSSASQLLVDFLYDYFGHHKSDLQFFTSNNLALRKEDFEKLGGFDESFPLPAAEDRDFCRRWRELRGQLRFVEKARVGHAHHLNGRGFWRQHFNYGRGAFHFHRLRVSAEKERIRVAPLTFYRDLMLFPFRRLGFRRGAPVSVLFAVTQIATVFGFFYQKFAD